MLNNKKTYIILHDLAMTAAAWLLAWAVRYDFYFGEPVLRAALYSLPVVLLIQAGISWGLGLYRGMWRFVSVADMWNILRAAVLGVLLIMTALFFATRLSNIPRSIFLLYPVFFMLLLSGPRLLYRLWSDNAYTYKPLRRGQRVLIIGAGRAGEMLARDMLRNDNYSPVGFVDDDARLKRSALHGIPVLGRVVDLPTLLQRLDGIARLVIAIPSATSEQMQTIISVCAATGIPLSTLPALAELARARAVEDQLHAVSIDDLLGRDKVDLDWRLIKAGLSGKVVLVSGGGGSIGSELCRQLHSLAPARLVIFERSEFNLYRIQQRLEQAADGVPIDYVLGDVCDEQQVALALQRYRPQLIFHAAAYKHVPLLEAQPREAVKNNIVGTQVLASQASARGVEKFVLISTDKAVNPDNALGKTKRIAEILCALQNRRSTTQFIAVRFGNVLGSEGSVVPLFKEQIARGGPVTVTHPDISRYFMTISESCQLIMQAAVMSEGGEIFVLDMGEPVKIAYLAEQMIRLSGLKVDEDIAILYTGLRPGEKLHEELYHAFEQQQPTPHEKIRLARHDTETFLHLQSAISAFIKDYRRYEDAQLSARLTALARGLGSGNDANIVTLNAQGLNTQAQ